MSSESGIVSSSGSGAGIDRTIFVEPDEVFDAVQETLSRKWHLRIVYQLLENGPLGFSALKGEIVGISSKMLSESLTSLEEDGLVDREIVNDQPVRVEYSLTERGDALEPVVSELVSWGVEHGIDESNP
ncbi:winged helix-turn-helix transcriptional regulator [Halapricum desulfuricans]|uniref:DNA-binding transcriptional regulator, HxlR family n=1 Tax=Halapricum desulfuricans TaxID=2841257 RepID=A0A897NR28_9EURY|nr:helix-turn-helix domain-containing protein [Halapricum desulfuricans]QSG15257.1 DNA-binding transcriptional regulator, HxlR family [Halapricum desulfuricans]